MTETLALWHQSLRRSSIDSEPLPDLSRGWCEIKTIYSGLSPGTERLVSSGRVPEELYEEMRVPYMGGHFGFPIKYGYSLVGKVRKGPEKMMEKIVHVLHPHQDRCIVRLEDAFLVPADVPPRRATLASNLEAAVNGVWDSKISLGDRTIVVGFGIIGSLVARLLQQVLHVETTVVDTDSSRLTLAKEMGFRACPPPQAPGNQDVAFHASGTGQGLQTALDKVGLEGRVVDLSWYGSDSISLKLGGKFHSQRKTIVSSQVSNIPASHRSRWDKKRRKQLVFSLLSRPEFDEHITHSMDFRNLPRFFDTLRQNRVPGLAHLVTYGK